MSEIIEVLRDYYGLPVNFIQAASEIPISLKMRNASLNDIIASLVKKDTNYRYEIIKDRFIIFPADSFYYSRIDNISISDESRINAANKFVECLKKTKKNIPESFIVPILGNFNSTLYQDHVTLSKKGRVLDHFIDLLGSDASVIFTLTSPQDNISALFYSLQDKYDQNANICKLCRPVALNYTLLFDDDCIGARQWHPDIATLPANYTCGRVQVYSVDVIHENCPNEDNSCAGAPVTEEVYVTDGLFKKTKVKIGQGNVGSIIDTYAACADPNAIPMGPVTTAFTEFTQTVKICGIAVMKKKIRFDFYNSGFCSASVTQLEPVFYPPHSCSNKLEKTMNRDSKTKPKPTMSLDGNYSRGMENLAVNSNLVQKKEKDHAYPPQDIFGANYDYDTIDTTTFTIPIGTAFGNKLFLITKTFLPSNWSYSISDSGDISTPDTIMVKIYHDKLISCSDTGRVFIYSYTPSDEYAGNAELSVYAVGERGDFNNSDEIDDLDISQFSSFLYQFGPPPVLLETAELSNDKKIDIADLARLVDYLYNSHSPFVCQIDTNYLCPTVKMGCYYEDDTTVVVFDSPEELYGLQFEFNGSVPANPISLAASGLDLVYGSQGDSMRVALFDKNGTNTIKPGLQKILKIPGKFILRSATAADQNYHSTPVLTGLAYNRAKYHYTQPGWQMISLPVLPKNVQVDSLFPSAIQKSLFTWNGTRYEQLDSLQVSHGYWIAIPGDTTVEHLGIQVDSYRLFFSKPGWYMIGSVIDSIDFSDPQDDPDGSIISPAYTYDTTTKSYTLSNKIVPDQGYWIAVAQECALNVDKNIILKNPVRAAVNAEQFYKKYGALPPSPPKIDWRKIPVPDQFKLEQSYPNPFNPTTTIEFSLPFDCKVDITIYNIFGQIVRNLAATETKAGYHTVKWDGTNNTGVRMASGVYIYRIIAGSFVDSHKMILLK